MSNLLRVLCSTSSDILVPKVGYFRTKLCSRLLCSTLKDDVLTRESARKRRRAHTESVVCVLCSTCVSVCMQFLLVSGSCMGDWGISHVTFQRLCRQERHQGQSLGTIHISSSSQSRGASSGVAAGSSRVGADGERASGNTPAGGGWTWSEIKSGIQDFCLEVRGGRWTGW